MQYMSAKEAAEKWGVGLRRVQVYCAGDRIPGAVQIGNQWIIPATATRPIDGRVNRRLKLPPDPDLHYRFPMLAYTSAFVYSQVRDEDEKNLLKAQVLYLEGKFVDSISLCRNMLKQELRSHVEFGFHVTIAYNAIGLGLQTEYRNSLAKAESILLNEKNHQEDLKLILEMLKRHFSRNVSGIKNIDATKLSAAGLQFYQFAVIISSAMNAEEETEKAVFVYEALCRLAEKDGVLTSSTVMHFVLAAFYRRLHKMNAYETHIHAACEAAYLNRWTGILAHHYNSVPAGIDTFFTEKDPDYLEEIRRVAEQTTESWLVTDKPEKIIIAPKDADRFNNELMRLLANERNNVEIAGVLGCSNIEVFLRIKSLCDKLNCQNRHDLIAYCKSQFADEMSEEG